MKHLFPILSLWHHHSSIAFGFCHKTQFFCNLIFEDACKGLPPEYCYYSSMHYWGSFVCNRAIIVLMAVAAYGFFMDMIRENIMVKWAVYCVECTITGTGILYTPAFILAYITGWIAFLFILESQYGSIENILDGALESMESVGVCILMLMGIYFMVTSIKKKK